MAAADAVIAFAESPPVARRIQIAAREKTPSAIRASSAAFLPPPLYTCGSLRRRPTRPARTAAGSPLHANTRNVSTQGHWPSMTYGRALLLLHSHPHAHTARSVTEGVVVITTTRNKLCVLCMKY